MRESVLAIGLALVAALAAWAATPAAKDSKAKPPAAKKSGAKTPRAKAPPAKTKGKATTSAKKPTGSRTSKAGKQTTARYRRSTQQEPTPERYREIQQSLADKGYFAGPVDGKWGPDSVEALKRFQRDQKIGDDGKLGSLSLIALGLGPKHGASSPPSSESPSVPDARHP